MKLTRSHSRMLACSLSLLLLPVAFAGGGDKDKGMKFDKMDTNSDGMISREENAAGAQRMFTEMDANSDGVISSQERMGKKDGMMAKKDGYGAKPHDAESHTPAASGEKMHNPFDQDGDGQITAAEHTAGAAALFDKMDTDHNGSLSKDEFNAGHKSMMKDRHE